MDKFHEMQTFSAVATVGSFVGAAEVLGISKAAASRNVSELEARLGVRLIQRTTRRLALTEIGEVFHARCQALLAHLDEAEGEATSRSGKASGLLKVNAPVSFGILHLAALWSEFATKNPQISLNITLADRVVDLVEEGVDLAIRIGQLSSSTLVARKLATTRVVLCASPKYLKKNGTPRHPGELIDHTVLSYSYLATGDQWLFHGLEGEVRVTTHPRIHTNNGDTCRVAALAHQGIILQPTFLIGHELASGQLVEIMPQFESVELGIYAVYPSRRFVAPKVRLLIDFLATHFKKTHWPK